MRSLSITLVMVVAILALSACTTPHPPQPKVIDTNNTDIFPVPAELRPQIDFWRHVYAVWSRSQVALHDDEYLNLVYQVIDLPGPVRGGYTAAQKRLLRERKGAWQARLRELERKTTEREVLNPDERVLAARITVTVGTEAIFGASKRLRTQRGLRERFKRGLEISGRYDALFRDIFRQASLPEDLAYLPHVESSFQFHARSSAGAVGMWQFTKPAARLYMTNHPALDERLDPVASARGAARYLSDAYSKLGNWSLTVTSYNHGIGGMQRAKSTFGTDFMDIVRHYQHRAFGFASRNFYAEFLAAREVASNPTRFFPEGIRYEAPLAWDRVVLRGAVPASKLARRYGVDKKRLISMNPAWTRAARRDRVALPAGTEVWLPSGTLQRTAQLQEVSKRNLALADGSERVDRVD